ncbi:MAG: hypothetical protein ACREK6_03630, partial [Candidatus Rokuibacteriota bacterium]
MGEAGQPHLATLPGFLHERTLGRIGRRDPVRHRARAAVVIHAHEDEVRVEGDAAPPGGHMLDPDPHSDL